MKTSIRADGWTKDNECRSMPRYMEYNGDINKFYYKRLMCKFLDGSVNYIGKMLLPSPTKKLIVEYESLKKEFTSDLFTDVCARINRFEIEKNVKI